MKDAFRNQSAEGLRQKTNLPYPIFAPSFWREGGKTTNPNRTALILNNLPCPIFAPSFWREGGKPQTPTPLSSCTNLRAPSSRLLSGAKVGNLKPPTRFHPVQISVPHLRAFFLARRWETTNARLPPIDSRHLRPDQSDTPSQSTLQTPAPIHPRHPMIGPRGKATHTKEGFLPLSPPARVTMHRFLPMLAFVRSNPI